MRVSQRVDYAVRLLVALAMRPAGEYTAVGELARDLSLPRRFSEQQVTELARAGIVSCRRGTAGGCRLDRPADTITVDSIVRALQGDVLDVPRTARSATAEMWAEAARTLRDALGRVTIADLARRQREIEQEHGPVYYI